MFVFFFFFSSRRRHTRLQGDWSSDVCSSDLNATVAMNVTAPRAPMDYFFEHHSATLVFFIHQGGGTLETMFGPIEFRKGDFLIVPKGIAHRFELQAGPQSYWVYESFAGDPEKSEAPTTEQFITHSRSDYKFPRTLDTRNQAGPRP